MEVKAPLLGHRCQVIRLRTMQTSDSRSLDRSILLQWLVLEDLAATDTMVATMATLQAGRRAEAGEQELQRGRDPTQTTINLRVGLGWLRTRRWLSMVLETLRRP